MALPWPGTLPDLQAIGLNRTPVDGRVLTNMDAGPVKIRQRYTATPTQWSIPVQYTGAQVAAFDTWWNDLNGGVDSFLWESPLDDSTVTMKFLSYPDFNMIIGGKTSGVRQWTGTLEIEEIVS